MKKNGEAKLNFEQLGRRFELNAGSIRAAIASAVAEAAMREGEDKSGVNAVSIHLIYVRRFSLTCFIFFRLLNSETSGPSAGW